MIKARMILDTKKLDAMEKFSPQVADNCSYDAADWVIEYIKAHWSFMSPSLPGNPPAKLTGDLERSLRAERRTRGRFAKASGDNTEWAVIAGEIYAAALEYGKVNAPNTIIPRPFMRPAIEAAKTRFPSFFGPIINPKTKVYNTALGFVPANSIIEISSSDFYVDTNWGMANDMAGE